MFGTIVVPLDGSDMAARALAPATQLAARFDSDIHVVGYAAPIVLDDLAGQLERQCAGVDESRIRRTVSIPSDSVAAGIAEVVENDPGSLVVMSSVGESHTGRALGSVAEAILERIFGPIVVVGPGFDTTTFAGLSPSAGSGVVTATVDGSDTSESILPVAEAWALAGGFDLEIVTVLDPEARRRYDSSSSDLPAESALVARLATRARAQIGRSVEYEVLHGHDAAKAIALWATDRPSSMIAIATHGRGGLRRLIAGSVAMSVVHRAPCPVLLLRPPHLHES